MIIAKDFGTVSIAHQLPAHLGKCHNLHGHDYHIKAGFRGRVQRYDPGNSENGMVLDFAVLKGIYKEKIEAVLDHALLLGEHEPPWVAYLPNPDTDLGKVARLPVEETTAELIAEWIAKEFQLALKGRTVEVVWVELYETPTSYARWQHESL